MPFVNLIHEQRQEALRTATQAKVSMMAFLGAAFVTCLGFGFISFQSASLASKKNALEAEIKKQEPTEKTIEANKKALDQLRPRLDTLKDAQAQSDKWSRLLSHLSVQTPAPVWLTHIRSEQTDIEHPISMILTGLCSDQQPVGEYMLRIQNSNDVENVALKYTSEKSGMKQGVIEFEVTAELAGTAQKKPKAAETGTEAKA